MRDCTLIFLHRPKEKEILLAMKKRRFGTGKWNGVGGKLEGSESIIESAARETKEEICVDIRPEDLKQVATIDFFFDQNPDWDQRAHVFFAERWQGEPCETDEMKPEWFKTDAIPFEAMWIDDIFWLPRVLEGEKIKATFTFDKNGDIILDKKVENIKEKIQP